jgi:hypothetical protein
VRWSLTGYFPAAGEGRDHCHQLGGVDGFADMHLVSREQRALAIHVACKRGEGYCRNATRRARHRAHVPDEVVTIAFGHADVAHYAAESAIFAAHRSEPFGSRGYGYDFRTALLEHPSRESTSVSFVVDHEDAQPGER